ncbi:hypothetical protein [Streptomyces sp. NPDC051567]|uniref:hypothetical protein n=1 Tax=Streptomyces sp. NPDC051567 TaxID=3365660 RepID=UPI003788AAE0
MRIHPLPRRPGRRWPVLVAAVSAAALTQIPLTLPAHAAVPTGCTVVPVTDGNTITCTAGIPAGQTLDTGPGNDHITITGTVLGTVNGQEGDDQITVTGTPGVLNVTPTGPGVAPAGIVDGGAGTDTITVTGGAGIAKFPSKNVAVGTGGPGVLGAVRGGTEADSITVTGGAGGAPNPNRGAPGGPGTSTGAVVDGGDGADTSPWRAAAAVWGTTAGC